MNLFNRLFNYDDQVETIMNLDNEIEELQDVIKSQQSEIKELRGNLKKKLFVIGRYIDDTCVEHKIVGNYIKHNEVYLNGESVAYFDYINYCYDEECLA